MTEGQRSPIRTSYSHWPVRLMRPVQYHRCEKCNAQWRTPTKAERCCKEEK